MSSLPLPNPVHGYHGGLSTSNLILGHCGSPRKSGDLDSSHTEPFTASYLGFSPDPGFYSIHCFPSPEHQKSIGSIGLSLLLSLWTPRLRATWSHSVPECQDFTIVSKGLTCGGCANAFEEYHTHPDSDNHSRCHCDTKIWFPSQYLIPPWQFFIRH